MDERHGLPPTLLQVGSDILLDDALRLKQLASP
jgi:hypothetical protein